MASKGRKFAGCTVALVTPFRDGAIDEPALRKLVDWHVEQGTPIISPVGTTGESPTLTHEEHERVIDVVIDQAAGRARIMAGTGSNSTAEAVRLTRYAARAGADAALVVTPYYNRPTQEGMYAHYARIAEAVELPMVLYNVPARTGRNLEPETVERLARVGPVVAIKEAAGSLDQVSDIRVRCPDLTVLSGDDSLTLPMMAVGAEGVVSVVANLVPREVIALIEAVGRGDLAGAQAKHLALYPLCRDLLGAAPNPIPIKTAMALLGRGNGELRLPLDPPGEALRQRLAQTLTRFGLATA
jgi:4-hydroxy-tetrahydrodipicolinate synthase